MNISSIHPLSFEITGVPGLDPVRVFIQDLGLGQGRLIIECYGQAWSSYWGGMGTGILQFIAEAEVDYIANRIERNGPHSKRHEREYLYRIVAAVRQAVTMILAVVAEPFGNRVLWSLPNISDDPDPQNITTP